MSEKLMLIPDKAEVVAAPQIREVWTTAAGPVELSLPMPCLMTEADVGEVLAWLEAVGKKIQRLRGVRAGLLADKPATPAEVERWRREFEGRFERKAQATKPKPDGSDIKLGWYEAANGDKRLVKKVDPIPGVGVLVLYEKVCGNTWQAMLAEWHEWAKDAIHLGGQ